MWNRKMFKYLSTLFCFVIVMCLTPVSSFAEKSLIDIYQEYKQTLIKADVKAEQGIYIEAVELYKIAKTQFLQFKQDHSDWGSMVLVDIQISRCEDKIKELKDLIVRAETFRDRYQSTETTQAHDQVVDETPKATEDFDQQLRRADALLANQEYQRALVHLENALKIVPHNPYARLSKSVCLFKLKNTAQTIEVLKQLINDYPKFASAQYNLADVYYSLGDLNKAVVYYKNAIGLDQQDLRSRVNLGVIYVKQKRYNAALDLFAYVLKRDDSSADAHYNLGVIYSDYLFDRGRAIFHYSKYIEVYPGAPDAWEVSKWIKDLEQGRKRSNEMAKK